MIPESRNQEEKHPYMPALVNGRIINPLLTKEGYGEVNDNAFAVELLRCGTVEQK
jgi:hypothetical protein